MARLAECPNVTVKLGALNMSFTGMDATDRPRPHTSEETALLQRDHILTAIDLFGPDRCMFESNFPVDMRSISRSEEHKSELQSLMRISYAVFCLKKTNKLTNKHHNQI